jgi:hypothetical protein
MGENRRRRRTNIIHATRRAARQVNFSVPHRDSPAHLGVDRSFAGRIKKAVGGLAFLGGPSIAQKLEKDGKMPFQWNLNT